MAFFLRHHPPSTIVHPLLEFGESPDGNRYPPYLSIPIFRSEGTSVALENENVDAFRSSHLENDILSGKHPEFPDYLSPKGRNRNLGIKGSKIRVNNSLQRGKQSISEYSSIQERGGAQTTSH